MNDNSHLGLQMSPCMKKQQSALAKTKTQISLALTQKVVLYNTSSSGIKNFKVLACVTVQAVLCRTWSETQIVGFLMQRLKKRVSVIMIIFLSK